MSSCCEPNIKDTLAASDAVNITERCQPRTVDASYFLSRMVESFTVAVNGQDLTVTLNFADGNSQSQSVTLP